MRLNLTQIIKFFNNLNNEGTFKNNNNSIKFIKDGRSYFINVNNYRYWIGNNLEDLNRLFKFKGMQGVFKFLIDRKEKGEI